MIAFADLLVEPAKEAGIKVPDDFGSLKRDNDVAIDLYLRKFPHFLVYINMQVGRSLPYASSHWDNAKIIAKISDEDILTIDVAGIEALGFH